MREHAVGHTRTLPHQGRNCVLRHAYNDVSFYYFLQFNTIIFEGNSTEGQM